MNFMASGTIKSSHANPAHELRMYNLFLLDYFEFLRSYRQI